MKFYLKLFFQFIAASIITALIYFYENSNEDFSALRKFCDGTFVASLLFFAAGGIKLVSRAGAFNAISFGFSKLIKKNKKNYFEYCNEKKENCPAKDFSFLITAAVFLIASIVLAFFC